MYSKRGEEPIVSELFDKIRVEPESIREREDIVGSVTVHAHNAPCLCAGYRYIDTGYWSIDRFGTLPGVHATLVLSNRATIIDDWQYFQ